MSERLCFFMRYLVLVLVPGVGIYLAPRVATADTYWDEVTDNAAVVIDTALGNLTAREEKELIGQNWDNSRDQRRQEGKTSIGQVAKNGIYPVLEYTLADLGSNETLTFFFIDPADGQRTEEVGFQFSAVRYDALLDPSTLAGQPLTEATIRQNLTTIGTSSNAGTDYELNFVLQGFEPIILAFPLDALGNEVPGEGTAAYVAQVLVPEPSTLALFGMGALVLLGYGRMRRRAAL